jgi:hypothetical protein
LEALQERDADHRALKEIRIPAGFDQFSITFRYVGRDWRPLARFNFPSPRQKVSDIWMPDSILDIVKNKSFRGVFIF